jgi:hypothetical protein
MPKALIVASLVGTLIVISAVAAVIKAPRLGKVVRFVAALPFAPIGIICLYGFAAAMEPGDFHVIWRILYAAVFFACLGAIGRLLFSKSLTGASR